MKYSAAIALALPSTLACAALSNGAYVPFDLTSAERLRVLLGAVAVYVTGGYAALESYAAKQGGEVLRLSHQLRRS